MNKDDFLIEFTKSIEKYWRPVSFDSEIILLIKKDDFVKASNVLHEKIFPQKKHNTNEEMNYLSRNDDINVVKKHPFACYMRKWYRSIDGRYNEDGASFHIDEYYAQKYVDQYYEAMKKFGIREYSRAEDIKRIILPENYFIKVDSDNSYRVFEEEYRKISIKLI